MSRSLRPNRARYYGEDVLGHRGEQEVVLFNADWALPDAPPPPSPSSSDDESDSEPPAAAAPRRRRVIPEQKEEFLWDSPAGPLDVCPFGGVQRINPLVNIPPSPLTCFLHFLPNAAMIKIVRETNMYAEAKEAPGWCNTSLYEIKQFLAVLIFMGIVDMGQTSDYWSGVTTQPFVTKIFSRNRFQELLGYLHLASSADPDAPSQDKLFKVRWLLELVRQACISSYSPSSNLAVDEAMIGFKGRIGFKQYMPAKPTKWGIKVWSLADSANGYLLNFEVYTGAVGADEKKQEAPAQELVQRLMAPYEGKYYRLWMDNYFSSIPLFRALLAKQIYASGTIRKNRKGFPKDLADLAKKKDFKDMRGQYVTRQLGADMILTMWVDNGVVTFLSTSVGADKVEQIKRRQPNGEKKDVPCPGIVLEYNRSMGAVDLNDQRRSTYPIGRVSHRWWMPIFYYLIDICIINAYILFNFKYPDRMTHKEFRIQLMNDLLEDKPKTNTRRKRRPSNDDVVIGEDHFIITTSKYRCCLVCSKRKQVEGKEMGERKRTKYKCMKCHVYLCPDDCFSTYHAQLNE